MKRCVIGAGYIGKALLGEWKGYPTVATTRRTERIQELHTVADDVAVLPLEKAMLDGVDTIVVTVAPSRGESYEEAYLGVAKSLLSVLPASVQQVIYTSSTSVYGDCQGQWVDETAKIVEGVLSQTEAFYLENYPSRVTMSVLRLAGIYGPGREHERRIAQFGATLDNSYCNWAHQEDIVRAIDWVVQHRLGGIYNVCSDDHPTRSELYGPMNPHQSTSSRHFGNRRVSNEKLKKSGFSFYHSCYA